MRTKLCTYVIVVGASIYFNSEVTRRKPSMDSDDEELESFEITDFDLLNEFNPNRFKKKKGTKNQAIYGIWSKESDDEEDQRTGFGSGNSKKGFDAMEDMGFVSAGFKGVNEAEDEAVTDEEIMDENAEEEKQKEEAERLKKVRMTRAEVAHAHLMKADKNLGAWQRNTKGIGEKLLLQMGYIPGKGLGKANQGIIRPVEATKRRGKGAIGAHGSEHPELEIEEVDVIVNSEEEEYLDFKEELSQWKKVPGQDGKKKKVTYNYRTAEEVLRSGLSKKNRKHLVDKSMSKVKVIDMTQPEQKVMSGYGELAHQHDRPMDTAADADKRGFEMPELEHNLQLLVEMSEQQIVQHNRQRVYEEDMVINLQHEKSKLEGVLQHEERQILRLKNVLNIVNSCEENFKSNSDNPLALDEFEIILKQFQVDHVHEYRAFQISQLSVIILFPFVKKDLCTWVPFADTTKHLDFFKKWKRTLDNVDNSIVLPEGPTITVYERLIWEVWMPCVRRAIVNWSVRSSDKVQEFLENWIPLVPVWVKDNLFDQLIMPKLMKAVEDWDPLTDVVPIHSWIHPWLPLLGDKLEPLYGPIRQKFANALTNWHPSDSSAKTILTPWMAVFSQGTMDAFILRNIIPKLTICLQEFTINPYKQHLQPLQWVLAWDSFLPTPALVSLFQKNFFPRWIQVLCSWLGNNPNFDEVSNWFTGWKGLFPTRLMTEPCIKYYFNDALAVMNRAVSGHTNIKENLSFVGNEQRQRDSIGAEQWEERKNPQVAAKTDVPTTFRDFVEKRAQEEGIIFVPTNRRREGKIVFAFGSCHVYIEKGVLFVSEGTEWKPIALSVAIGKARGIQ